MEGWRYVGDGVSEGSDEGCEWRGREGADMIMS